MKNSALFQFAALTILSLFVGTPAGAQTPCKPAVGNVSWDRDTHVFYTYDSCATGRQLRTIVVWRGVQQDARLADQFLADTNQVSAFNMVRKAYPNYALGGMLSSKGSWWLVANTKGEVAALYLSPATAIEFVHEYAVPGPNSILVTFLRFKGPGQTPEIEAAETLPRRMTLPASEVRPLSRVDRDSVHQVVRETKFAASWTTK